MRFSQERTAPLLFDGKYFIRRNRAHDLPSFSGCRKAGRLVGGQLHMEIPGTPHVSPSLVAPAVFRSVDDVLDVMSIESECWIRSEHQHLQGWQLGIRARKFVPV